MSDLPAAAPYVSIVIVSWNTRRMLDRCLEAAFASSPELSREVLVIDNASSDGSAEWVAERWPAVTLVRNPENRGYAPACNQGLRAARGRHVLALNSDAFLIGDALGELARRLEGDPGLAAAGPRLLNADGTTQFVCARRAPGVLPTLLGHTPIPARIPALLGWVSGAHPRAWYGGPHETEVLSGACVLFRRQALERVGLLDRRLVLNYDDVEWSLRARRAGLRLAYEPRAQVTHLGGQSRIFEGESMPAANLESACYFWDLSFTPPLAFLFKLSLILSLALTLLKNAALAPFAPRRRRRAAHVAGLIGHVTRLLTRRLAADPEAAR